MNIKAKDLIKSKMVISGCSVADLNKELPNFGIKLTEQSLANKISRGSFSADFFIILLHIMGVDID